MQVPCAQDAYYSKTTCVSGLHTTVTRLSICRQGGKFHKALQFYNSTINNSMTTKTVSNTHTRDIVKSITSRQHVLSAPQAPGERRQTWTAAHRRDLQSLWMWCAGRC